MVGSGSTYFTQYVEAGLEQAKRVTGPYVTQVHNELAQAYLERLTSDVRVDFDARK